MEVLRIVPTSQILAVLEHQSYKLQLWEKIAKIQVFAHNSILVYVYTDTSKLAYHVVSL